MTASIVVAPTLPVAEIFGPTWQGEGRHAGQRVGFLRLAECNLACDWCDTAYTWDRSRYDVAAECPPTTVENISTRLAGLGVSIVILSGGEPLIHARPIDCPLARVLTTDYQWHVETNGTLIPPTWMTDALTYAAVSPKINTTDSRKRRLRPEALAWWATAAHQHWADFKFVAQTRANLDLIDELVSDYRIPRERVWIMPEGTCVDRLLARHRSLAPAIAERGYNTTTRLHTLLWGDERGR